MTRARAPDRVATPLIAEYYRQRAGAGLIVSEGTPISPEARGFLFVPELHTEAQTVGWKQVTDLVHSEGGTIFAQLWHVGRVSHVSLQPDGRAPVGPTASQGGAAFARDEAGKAAIIPASPPRPLRTDEMPRLTADFARAAECAMAAGFDGVELHAANGYLFEQFLNPAVNLRGDRYGGSIANRARLLLDTAEEIAARIGSGRLGVRLSPFSFLFDMPEYDSCADDYVFVARELGRRGLAYLHLMDQGAVSLGFDKPGVARIDDSFLARLRDAFGGKLILTGGLEMGRAQQLIDAGLIDLAGMGRAFIANPDLVERLQAGHPLAVPDPATFYGGGAAGYTDYPRWLAG